MGGPLSLENDGEMGLPSLSNLQFFNDCLGPRMSRLLPATDIRKNFLNRIAHSAPSTYHLEQNPFRGQEKSRPFFFFFFF